MVNIINAIVGDLNEKKRYRNNEKRAKELPGEYAAAYKEIRNYLWTTSGILTIDPLITLVDMLEEAAAEKRKVTDITGPDVAAFADELVRGEKSYKDQQGEKLNKKLNNKE
jgi:DNA-binding ferritin-like protein (Dps family)